jgi:hypothetical protein
MPKEKTMEEKLEEASSAVERALEARDCRKAGLAIVAITVRPPCRDG